MRLYRRATWTDPIPRMADLLTPVERPLAKVDVVTVTRETSIVASLGDPWGPVEAGRYARLLVRSRPDGHWSLIMSDTPMERRTNRDVIDRATGDVLIAGLGLGMILHPILAKPEVRSVTVIEKNPDVIECIGPSLPHRYLTIVEADVFAWRPAPGQKFDVQYFDIWEGVCSDYATQAGTLHRRFARAKRSPDSWVSSWRLAEMRERRRQERDEFPYLYREKRAVGRLRSNAR